MAVIDAVFAVSWGPGRGLQGDRQEDRIDRSTIHSPRLANPVSGRFWRGTRPDMVAITFQALCLEYRNHNQLFMCGRI